MRPVRINPPATETQLFSFELQGLTPSVEAVQESSSFQGALANPQQFSQAISSSLAAPNGLVLTAAALSDLMGKGQTKQLLTVWNQAFGQQPAGATAAQAGPGATPSNVQQANTAFALAVIDRVRITACCFKMLFHKMKLMYCNAPYEIYRSAAWMSKTLAKPSSG